MAQHDRPPFRADHVGSLLRPKSLTDARQKWRQGELPEQELREIEDAAIRDIVDFQQDIGLKAITDGEFRRDYWHLDFIAGFEGIELSDNTFSHAFSGGGTVATFKITGKIGSHSGSMRDHFSYLKSIVAETAKFCLPGPGMENLNLPNAGPRRIHRTGALLPRVP